MIANAPADHLVMRALVDTRRAMASSRPRRSRRTRSSRRSSLPTFGSARRTCCRSAFARTSAPAPTDAAPRRARPAVSIASPTATRPTSTAVARASLHGRRDLHVATDCESHDCTDGVCGAPSCTDGFRDGLETDVDCGWRVWRLRGRQDLLDRSDCASGHVRRALHPDDCSAATADRSTRVASRAANTVTVPGHPLPPCSPAP